MPDPKRKSTKRFEQLNRIVDIIAPTLPTPSHVAVLLCCFRHGRENGYFRVSTPRLAKTVGLKNRRVQDIIDSLVKLNVLEFVSEHIGPIPRTYKINYKVADGAARCTINSQPVPQADGAAHCT